jgi:hypothetical protein
MTKPEPKAPETKAPDTKGHDGGMSSGGKTPDRRDHDETPKASHGGHAGTPDGAKGAGGRTSTTGNPSGTGRGNNPQGGKKE